MNLTGFEIENEVRAGHTHVDDFAPERLKPKSYGLGLAAEPAGG